MLCERLQQNYFPYFRDKGSGVLSEATVVPSEPKTYRRICINPTLGQLLEKY